MSQPMVDKLLVVGENGEKKRVSYFQVIQDRVGRNPDGSCIVPRGEPQHEVMYSNVLLIELIEEVRMMRASLDIMYVNRNQPPPRPSPIVSTSDPKTKAVIVDGTGL